MEHLLNGYLACICEGAAEQAIMELLLENQKLIFNKEQMLEEKIIRCRDARTFESRYLGKNFDKKIVVLRILDSRKENFKLSKAYENKIDVINIITAPEIEMLIIFKEGKYDEYVKYRNSGMKPSEYCKVHLKYRDVKSYNFVKEYFGNINELIKSINEYKRVSRIQKCEYTLCDLLKSEHK